MTHDVLINLPDRSDRSDELRGEQKSNQLVLSELVAALKPHPRGLRRWSVMRAIRIERSRVSRDIPLKFESDMEGVFRKFSADPMDAHVRVCAVEKAPFCRLRNTAGEVWALRAGGLGLSLGEDVPADDRSIKGGP